MRNLIPLLAALAGLVAVPAAAHAERVVLSVGHTDALDVEYADGAFDVKVKDDTVEPSVRREPDDVIFHGGPEAEVVVPDGLPPEYAFLGTPGDTVWLLPEVQDPEVVWPGWETRLPTGLFADERVRFHLLEVDGPGRLQLFATDVALLPIMFFDSADGLPDPLDVSTHTHSHSNWAFSAPGLYTLTFEVTGALAGGGEISSGPVELRFFLGESADLPELPETALTVAGMAPSYAEGEIVSLRAAQEPDTGLDDYRWTSRCENGAAFRPVGSGPVLSFPAALARSGCQYRVTLRGSGGVRVASSAPVTLTVRDAPPATQPPAPAGDSPAPRGDAPRPRERLTLAASAARLRGRTLTLRLWLSAASRVSAAVRRGRRTVARAKPRSVGAGQRTVRLRLGRLLAPGRYAVRVRAASGSEVRTRTVRLRVR
jgi:surface-anchored protein